MADSYDKITPEQKTLIEASKLFFVASADPKLGPGPDGQGPVNLSPKGGAPLHIIDDRHVAYLDFAGSGNQTARHVGAGGPLTVMVMSMDGDDAAIVRLFGHAKATPIDESPLADRLIPFSDNEIGLANRQVIELEIDATQTSCGYGVPIFNFVADRAPQQHGRRFKD